jgi:hypothetical protein
MNTPLERACHALWSATLSLMVAYMQNPAPAHRLLLARRIAGNFRTLAQQDSYTQRNRDSFERLRRHWQGTAERLAGNRHPEGGRGLLDGLLRPGPQHL